MQRTIRQVLTSIGFDSLTVLHSHRALALLVVDVDNYMHQPSVWFRGPRWSEGAITDLRDLYTLAVATLRVASSTLGMMPSVSNVDDPWLVQMRSHLEAILANERSRPMPDPYTLPGWSLCPDGLMRTESGHICGRCLPATHDEHAVA